MWCNAAPEIPFDEMTFFQALTDLARRFPSKPAIVAGQSLGYAELRQQVLEAAAGLSSAGVNAQAVVGISIADEVQHLIASLSLLILGCRQLTLASFDSLALRTRLADRAGVTTILTDDGDLAIDNRTAVLWPCRGDASSLRIENDPDRTVIVLKTSGTTGDLNLVGFSGAQLAAQARRHADYADERLLRLASIEHNNSKRHRLYCTLMGGTNVFRHGAITSIADLCRADEVTCLDISRMHAADLVRQAAGPGVLLGGIKLRTGGSAVPAELRAELQQRVTPLLFVRYAATECGAIAMAGPGEHDGIDCVGRLLPGVQLETVDAAGEPLPPGTAGRIRLKAEGMAEGYLDSPADTARRFRDGWFYPGDMGEFDEAGLLYVRGREDDMMILNGLNIFPAEIERVLESHPAVKVAAALPLRSPVHGDIPVAAVELEAGQQVEPAELLQFARDRLMLRSPRRILVLPNLPRTDQGKILKRELQSLFAPKRDQQ